MATEPYGDWRDSECAPFIQDILDNKETRDRTRRIWADWLEDHGDIEHAQHLRNPDGYWEDNDWGSSWCVAPSGRKNKGVGCHLPLHWVGWNWAFPTKEYLQSKQCKALVKAWCSNYIYIEDHPWAVQIAKENGWNYHKRGNGLL